jgi:hypothetical protein
MRALPFLLKNHRQRFAVSAVFTFCILIAGARPVSAQYDGGARNDDSRGQGVNAGGNWKVFDSEDRMTAAKRVTFELVSDNNSREDRYARSKIEIFCENGKYKGSEFTPSLRLAPPNRPGIWGQPQMEVMVRVDSHHDYHGWNWNGRFLAMDKNTTRELLGAQIFRVEFGARDGAEIAEFSPAGLDLARVSHACGLSPKKP